MILLFRWKMKDDLSQKIHGNIIFSVYFGIIEIFSRKNTLKDDISGIMEIDDIHPRKYGTPSDRKIKDYKKVYFIIKKFQ